MSAPETRNEEEEEVELGRQVGTVDPLNNDDLTTETFSCSSSERSAPNSARKGSEAGVGRGGEVEGRGVVTAKSPKIKVNKPEMISI